MLKFNVRQITIVEEYHEMISFRLSKWLEKYNSFNTQKETNSD